MTFTLDEPPPGVDASAWSGLESARPGAGELWLLSWDGRALALCMIAGVAPTFVLAWPVTLPEEPAFRPALVIADTPLGLPLNLWPTRETGIGMHLLHRRLGSLLSHRTIALVEEALEDEGNTPVPFADENVPEERAEEASDRMVEHWEQLCFHTWPRPRVGTSPLSANLLRDMGMTLSDLAEALKLTPPRAVGMMRGEELPTADQLELIAQRLNLEPEALLGGALEGDDQLLISPEVKDRVLDIAMLHNTDEGHARQLLRSEFALAARSDNDPRTRLEAAVHRLLNLGEGS